MRRVAVVLGVAAAGVAAEATAATLSLDGTTLAPSTALFLDPGGVAPTDAPTGFTSRGIFGWVVAGDNLYNRASFHGDAFGLMSESRIIVTYTLFDVGDVPAALAAPGAAVDPGTPAADAAAALYTDAGSGTVYGRATVVAPAAHPGDAGSAPPVTIALNAAGVAAANTASAAAQPFVFGVAASTAPAPEPATWALLVAGFGLIGGRRRYFRPSTAARTAATAGRTL